MTEFWTKQRILAVAGVAFAHFTIILVLLFTGFRGERWDRGIPRSLLEEIHAWVLYVFMFPLINNPFSRLLLRLPSALEHGIFILNSLVWGIAIVWIVGWWRGASASG
jgi:hypothetical protein